MPTPASLVFDIFAVDRASAVFSRVGAAATLAGTESETGMARVGAAATKIAAGISIAVVAAGVLAVKMAADFQTSSNLLVTSAGESANALEADRKGLLAMAGEVGVSAVKLSEALYIINSAGVHGAEGLNVLRAAAQGAAAEGASVETVANALTTALVAYHLPASEATHVTDEFVAIVSRGKVRMDDLAGAISYVLPVASAAHVSFAEVGGALATMTAQGTSADQATTYLRQTIGGLLNPTTKARNELLGLGIDSLDLQKHLSERGLTGTIKVVSDAIKSRLGPDGFAVVLDSLKKAGGQTDKFQAALTNLPPALQSTVGATASVVGGVRTMMGILQLSGDNMPAFVANVAAVADANKNASPQVAGFERVQASLNFQIGRFREGMGAAATDLGTKLLPAATAVFGYLAGHKTTIEVIVVSIAALAVAITTYQIALKAVAVWEAAWNLAMLAGNTTIGIRIGLMGLEAVAALRSAAANTGLAGSMARVTLAAGGSVGTLAAFATRATIVGGVLYELNKHTDDMALALGAHFSPGVERLTKSLTEAANSGAAPKMTADMEKLGWQAKMAAKSLTNADWNPLSSSWWKQQSGQINAAQHSFKDLDQAFVGLVSSGHADQAKAAFDQLTVAARNNGRSVDDVRKLLPGYTTTLSQSTAQVNGLATGEGNAAAQAETLKGAQDKLRDAQDKLSSALQSSIDKFTVLNGGALSAESIAEDLTRKTDALSASVKSNGTSLDINTAAGVGNRQTIVDLMKTQNDKIAADFKSNQSTQGVGAALDIMSGQVDTNRTRLIAVMTQSGFTQAQAKSMADQFLLTPEQILTQFNTPGLTDAQQQIQNLGLDINGLPKLTDLAISLSYANGPADNPLFPGKVNFASGGPITGRGTGTSDSVPIWASHGEHMWTAAEVSAAGGHQAMIDMRRAVRGMAAGGPVLEVNTTAQGYNSVAIQNGIFANLNSTANVIRQHAQASFNQQAAASGGAGGAARWAPLVAMVAAMLGIPASVVPGVLAMINAESGGNPNAINLTDSNAAAGHPSRGLMQTIPGTFATYRNPSLSNNIVDPLANIYAGMNYALNNYGLGMLMSGGRHGSGGGYLGYETGTDWVPRTGPAILHQGEAVLSRQENARRGPTVNMSGQFYAYDPTQLAEAQERKLRDAMALEGLSR